MIVLEKVSKCFGSSQRPIPVIRELDWQVKRGEFARVDGPSGSGKTTLLNLIGGLTRPDRGRVLIGGDDLATLDDRALARLRGGTIGFAFQFPVFLFAAAALGLVSSEALRRQRRWAVIFVVIAAALMTPGGDPLTLLLLSAPMYLLYELAILSIRFILKR